MSKNIKILTIVLVIALMGIAHSKGGATLSGTMGFPVGNNSEEYDTFEKVGLGYEFRLNDYLGIHIGGHVGFVYAESREVVSVFIDNTLYGVSIMPKLFLPVTDKFSFVVTAGAIYDYVDTEVDVYAGYFKVYESTEDDQVYNFIAGMGVDFEFSKTFGIEVLGLYNPISGQNVKSMSMMNSSISQSGKPNDSGQVDISAISVQLSAKLNL